MKNKNINVKYYENTDFSKLIKNSRKKKYLSAKSKRITMNISEDTYQKAYRLDEFMSMGYQNVLKTAIILGLKDLYENIHGEKDLAKTLRKKKQSAA